LATPLGTPNGVETLYWVGTINANGTFNPFSSIPKEVELGTMGEQGYGLLSPSVMQKDGKTIAIGIVPDKLPSSINLQLGWAHLYSLPREWTLDSDNNLIQKPYAGVSDMRVTNGNFTTTDTDINGTLSLSPVSGKAVEIDGTFTISSATRFGFNVRKNGSNAIQVFYTPSANKITVNTTNISKLSNDAGAFNGLYESILPKSFVIGDNIRLHIFIDHSIMDIFINETYAFSMRVFPTDTNAEQVEAFSDGQTTRATSIQAWKLDPKQSATDVTSPMSENNIKIYPKGDSLAYENVPLHSDISVYNLCGQKITSKKSVQSSGQINLVRNQIYIIEVAGGNTTFATKILL
jgi:beta-fructofuranosidase